MRYTKEKPINQHFSITRLRTPTDGWSPIGQHGQPITHDIAVEWQKDTGSAVMFQLGVEYSHPESETVPVKGRLGSSQRPRLAF